jgi:hypothetical protein
MTPAEILRQTALTLRDEVIPQLYQMSLAFSEADLVAFGQLASAELRGELDQFVIFNGSVAQRQACQINLAKMLWAATIMLNAKQLGVCQPEIKH